jgi:hypothetical protein
VSAVSCRLPIPGRAVAPAGLAFTALVLLLAGCHSAGTPAPALPSGPDRSTPTGGPSSAAPTTAAGPGGNLVVVGTEAPADPTQARVFADYVVFWQRDMLALTTNDAGGAGVADYLFPPQAQTTAAYLAGRRRSGVRSQGVLRIAPTVTVTGRTSATVRDCLDQTGVRDVDRSGRRIALPGHVGLTVQLVRTPDGRWRVSRLAQTTSPDCP